MLLKCHIQTLCGADPADDRLKYALRNDLQSSFERLSVIAIVWIWFINSSKRRKSPGTENKLPSKKMSRDLIQRKMNFTKKENPGACLMRSNDAD